MEFTIQVGFRSDKGIKRRNNEDAFYVMPEEGIYMVADGVGGESGGEIASRTAVSCMAEHAREHTPAQNAADAELQSYFLGCMQDINAKIFEMAARHPENAGMATTMVLACIRGENAYLVNIGDSRAYLWHEDALRQITEDHTYVNELIKQGTITPEEARHHMRRNVITRALGGDLTVSPDVYKAKVVPGDILMLCTDGLHGEVREEVIAELFRMRLTMTETCVKLVNKANQNGGNDNITVICLKIQEGRE